MAFGGSIGRTISRSTRSIASRVGSASKLTLSKNLYANPGAVLGAWGDVGQETADPLMQAARQVPGGAATEDWVARHQREGWQLGALATGLGAAQAYGSAGYTAGALVAGGGTVAALGAEGYLKSERDAQKRAEAAASMPDLNEKNDPLLEAQFKRIRKGARMLGRAGTIKYKGAANLGLGEQTLGNPLALAST